MNWKFWRKVGSTDSDKDSAEQTPAVNPHTTADLNTEIETEFWQTQTQPWTRKKTTFLRSLLIPSVILLFFIGVLFALSQSNFSQSSGFSLEQEKIGILRIDDVILSSERIVADIENLRKNQQVKGVVLVVNSPGGATVPSYEIYQALVRLQKDKLLYVWMGNMATSGAYMASLAADKIFASPMSLTGSIGVILVSFSVKDLLNTLGIKPQVFTSGQSKDAISPFRLTTEQERQWIQSGLDDYHQIFVDLVKQQRGDLLKSDADLFDGRVFTARQAHANGLIDELLDYEGVVQQMQEILNIPDAQRYTPQEWSDDLYSSLQTFQWWKNFQSYFGGAPTGYGILSVYMPHNDEK